MIPELPGTQAIRVLDIFVLGPLMIWGAATPSNLPRPARLALGIFGVTTIGFNVINLVRHARRGSSRS